MSIAPPLFCILIMILSSNILFEELSTYSCIIKKYSPSPKLSFRKPLKMTEKYLLNHLLNRGLCSGKNAKWQYSNFNFWFQSNDEIS